MVLGERPGRPERKERHHDHTAQLPWPAVATNRHGYEEGDQCGDSSRSAVRTTHSAQQETGPEPGSHHAMHAGDRSKRSPCGEHGRFDEDFGRANVHVADLERLIAIEQMTIAPDGSVAFVAAKLDFELDRYQRTIEVLTSDGTQYSLTNGPFDSRPRWSPDGSRLAFLRKSDEDSHSQVAVVEVGRGEATVATDFPLGASDIAWAPDGGRLAVVGADWLDPADEDERARKPRRIRSLPYRADNAGWTHDRRSRIWLIDPAGEEEMVPLTDGAADESAPTWKPDGTTLAFLSDRTERTVGSSALQIWEIDVTTNQPFPRAGLGHWVALAYRRDGTLHAIGLDDFDDWPAPLGFWRHDQDGWVNLTSHLDRTLNPTFTDVTWIGDDAVLLLDDRGSTGIIRVEPDGTTHYLTRRDSVVHGCGSASDAGSIVFSSSTMVDPGEIRRIPASGSGETTLTVLNQNFRREVNLVAGQHFEVLSDGVDLDAWVYLPSGEARVPLLLNIHGGPAAQYSIGFLDEFQVYLEAGYGVVACNPRGSSGRGREFVKGVTGDGWGVVDLADVEAVVEAALTRYPRLRADRLGVMGGSYGGFLATWLIAHDHRFRSAIVERALVSWTSFSGTSDIGATFPDQYLGVVTHAEAWAKSPLSVADRITTPTLVLHSEEDFRCPISQAEQLFTVLLRAGVPSELVRFPGESHELSRTGRPRHRRERFEAILDWHARWLAENPTDLAN